MGFFDLNIPYIEPPRSGGKEAAAGKALRLKLTTKAMELGYVGIAHNRVIKGVMTDKDCCMIPLLTLGSLIKVAPRLTSSVGFHRDLLGIPRATPFRQYTRVTVHVESNVQCQGLNSGNPVLKSYDIVSVKPLNQNAFDHACERAEVDLISIDFSDKMPFRLKHPMVKAAIQRGIYFEIKYSDLLMDAQARRQVISSAKLLVDWTRGRNLIISSGAPSITELRGPNDVVNLMSMLGLSTERARAAISKNCRDMITKVLKKKRFHKEAVRVEVLSSNEIFSLEQPGDCLKWDPLSSGEGDMLLDDLANAFNETTGVANKSSKAIDFTSVLGGLPSHGFQVKDIIQTEPLAQPPAANIIDTAVQRNQVSELHMAFPASSNDNIMENQTISRISEQISEDDNKMQPTTVTREEKPVPMSTQASDMVISASSNVNLQETEIISQISLQISKDDSKVEPATTLLKNEPFALRKCSTNLGPGLLAPNQAADTQSDVVSDANMHIELALEDRSLSPSKSGHGNQQNPVENMDKETLAVKNVSVDEDNKEEATSNHLNGHHSSIDDDEMRIDDSLEANHEYMDVTAEDQKPEKTGDSNINLPNMSSKITDLLRESGQYPSLEAVEPHQLSKSESNEAEIIVEDQEDEETTMEGEIETESSNQIHVQSPSENNGTKSGKLQAKRSTIHLPKLFPFKHFLHQSRFKRISKRRKHDHDS